MQAKTVLIRCRACRTLNRVPTVRLGGRPMCGKCKAALEFPNVPVYGSGVSYDRTVNDWPMVLLVEFFAGWCGHCRAVEPAVNDIAAKHAGFVKVLMIDVDSEPGLSARFSVRGTPVFLLYRNGRLLKRLDGAPQSPGDLQNWVLQGLQG